MDLWSKGRKVASASVSPRWARRAVVSPERPWSASQPARKICTKAPRAYPSVGPEQEQRATEPSHKRCAPPIPATGHRMVPTSGLVVRGMPTAKTSLRLGCLLCADLRSSLTAKATQASRLALQSSCCEERSPLASYQPSTMRAGRRRETSPFESYSLGSDGEHGHRGQDGQALTELQRAIGDARRASLVPPDIPAWVASPFRSRKASSIDALAQPRYHFRTDTTHHQLTWED